MLYVTIMATTEKDKHKAAEKFTQPADGIEINPELLNIEAIEKAAELASEEYFRDLNQSSQAR